MQKKRDVYKRQSQERVYNKLSYLSNLEAIKDRLPQDKVEDLSFDSDTLSFTCLLYTSGDRKYVLFPVA